MRTLREYLIKAPPRKAALVQGIIQGSIFGIFMGFVFAYQNHERTAGAAFAGLFVAVGFGSSMAWRGTRQRREMRQAVGAIPHDKYLAAHDAARNGPIPSDPEIREAARHIVAIRLQTVAKAPTTTFALFGFFVLLSAYEAVTSDALYWIGVFFFAGTGLLTYRKTMTTRRRAQLFGITP